MAITKARIEEALDDLVTHLEGFTAPNCVAIA
jgi:hypothetical protein